MLKYACTVAVFTLHDLFLTTLGHWEQIVPGEVSPKAMSDKWMNMGQFLMWRCQMLQLIPDKSGRMECRTIASNIFSPFDDPFSNLEARICEDSDPG